MTLTFNILVKNDEETIGVTLKSLLSITNNILVGDIGSSDKTIDICKKHNVKVVSVPFKGDRSESKNYMIKLNKSWLMFIEPGETIVSMGEIHNDLKDQEASYRVKIVKGDLITKEIRAWHKNCDVKFKNPIFEAVKSDKETKDLNIFLTSIKDQFDEQSIKSLKEWNSNKPMSPEPLYYISCLYLMKKEWKNYVNCAETYLHLSKELDAPGLMTRYYLSMVKTYIKSQLDYKGAIKSLVQCIAEKPTVAEFWCLLGDLYYNVGDYKKSKSMYENAIILGSKRLENDDLPIEVSKYKSYPNKMIKACLDLEENTKVYKSINKL